MQITPTINRKVVSTAVGLNGIEQQERAVATMMSHSVEVARRSYQHTGTATEAVKTYQTIHTLQAGENEPEAKRPRTKKFFTQEEEDEITSFFPIAPGSKKPSAKLCREFLEKMKEKRMFDGRSVQNIQDKVRNIAYRT